MEAKDTMVVFQNGDELPGFLLYGLFPADADPWPRALPPEVLARRYDLGEDRWRICLWTMPVGQWLTGFEWQAAVSQLLTSICDQGAEVAWLASEGAAYAEPPWLFDPAEMAGGVCAYLTAGGRYNCPLDPGQPWAVVGDEEMASLREAAPLSRS